MNIYNENKRCKIKWYYNLFWKDLITFSFFVVITTNVEHVNVIQQISKYNEFTFLPKHIYFIEKFIRSKPVKKFKTIILAPITIIWEISFFSADTQCSQMLTGTFFKPLFFYLILTATYKMIEQKSTFWNPIIKGQYNY